MNEDSKDLFRTLIVGFIVIITLVIVVFGGIIISSKVELENDGPTTIIIDSQIR